MNGCSRCLLLLGLLAALPARAQNNDRTAAVALFEEAQALMGRGEYARACAKFAESNRLDIQIGGLINQADCYEKAGQLASAWSTWRDAADLAERRGDNRSGMAAERAGALEARLPRLTVIVPASAIVPGLVVKRDGTVLGPAYWGTAVPLDAGQYEIEAVAEGKVPWKTRVAVGAQHLSAAVTVPALDDQPVATSSPPPELEAAPSSSSVTSGAAPTARDSSWGSTQRVLGWSALGLGVVGLGVGIGFRVKLGSKLDERDGVCPTRMQCSDGELARLETLTSEARSAAALTNVGFIAGGVLVAGGVALLLTAPRKSLAVTPYAGKGLAALSLDGTW